MTRKVTKKTASEKKAPEVNEEDAVNDAAAQEAAEAEAQRESDLADLNERMAVSVANLRDASRNGTAAIRAAWIAFGDDLNAGAALFTTGNTMSNQKYSAWLTENGYKEVGARPTLAAARKLADIYNTNPELYACFPTDEVENMKTTPRTMLGWLDQMVGNVFSAALESGYKYKIEVDEVSSIDGDTNAKMTAASENLPKVAAFLKHHLTALNEAEEEAQKASNAKADDDKLRKAFVEAQAERKEVEKARDIFDAMPDQDKLSIFVRTKAPVEPAPTFNEMEEGAAVDWILAKLAARTRARAAEELPSDAIDILNGVSDKIEAMLDAIEEELDGDEESDESIPDEE